MAIIMLKSFILISSTSFDVYLAGMGGRPAWHCGLPGPNITSPACSQIQLHDIMTGTSQRIHPTVERPKPWIDGPTCSVYRGQAQNRLPEVHARVDGPVGAMEG
jgi:hypothetical protein